MEIVNGLFQGGVLYSPTLLMLCLLVIVINYDRYTMVYLFTNQKKWDGRVVFLPWLTKEGCLRQHMQYLIFYNNPWACSPENGTCSY